MKKLLQIILILTAFCSTSAKGQNSHHFKIYDYSLDSNLRRIATSALTADGGMVVLTDNEYRGSLSPADYGFSLIRYDQSGNKIWNTFISGFTTSNAIIKRIIELPDNGFAIAGNTTFNGGGFILKTDASGTISYMKSYAIQIYDCVLDPSDNGFILTTNAGNTYSGIIKTNSSGDVVWSDARNFLPDPDHYYMARRLNNGNYLAVGTAYDNPSISNGSGLIACYNSSGTLLWSQLYVGPEWTTGFMEFTELQDGSILLAGTSSQVAVPGLRTLITKVDSVGNVIWCKTSVLGSRIIDYGYEFSDGFLYMVGNYEWSGLDIRPATTKFNSNGDVLWTRIHPEYDYINDVVYGSSNDFSILGGKLGFNNTRTFCSTDTALTQSCALYDTAYTFVNTTMTTLPTSPVSVTPVTSASTLTRVNFSAVNYVKIDVCSQTGIAEGAIEKLTISLYPNPASEMIAIDISLNDFKPEMTINVFNNLGKKNKQFQLGSPNSILDLKGWDSGVYFYIINDKYNVLKTGRFIID